MRKHFKILQMYSFSNWMTNWTPAQTVQTLNHPNYNEGYKMSGKVYPKHSAQFW